MSAAALERKVRWVSEAAGARFDSLELNCNVFAVEINNDISGTMARLAADLGGVPGQRSDSPHVWVGSVEQIIEQLRERRSRFGLSYYAILGDLDLLVTAAPIVAALAGG